jgi:hypothetical protein
MGAAPGSPRDPGASSAARSCALASGLVPPRMRRKKLMVASGRSALWEFRLPHRRASGNTRVRLRVRAATTLCAGSPPSGELDPRDL